MNPVKNQENPSGSLVGSIEAGGTHFHCAIGYGDGTILKTGTFPTTSPLKTYRRVLDFFQNQPRVGDAIEALGISHFGPLALDKNATQYGRVRSTTKPQWAQTDVYGYFRKALGVPVALQTDVEGAAIGEHQFGASRDIDNFVYVTVGTGIGASVFIKGQLLQGSTHLEIGHMEIHQDRTVDDYDGCCSFHGNCLEGLASGPAIRHRWGTAGEKLATAHPAWALQARYLSALCANLRYCYSPEKIIFGGGVMSQETLLPLIRQCCEDQIGAYLAAPSDGYENFIVPSQLSGLAALKGGLHMATQALTET